MIQAFGAPTASFVVPAAVVIGLLLLRGVEKRVGLRS